MKSEIHNLFQNIENFFLTIKKNTSIEEKSCYNISDNLMLKTISYSIQLVSSFLKDKEQGKEYQCKVEDDIFVSLKSSIAIRKILVDVFNDDNIKVETTGIFPNDTLKSSNGFVFSFKFPAFLTIQYKYNDNEKDCKDRQEEVKNNIQAIITNIIKEIKNINNNENNIYQIGIKYLYEIDCERPDEKINSLFKTKYEDEEKSIIAKTFKKNDTTKLNLSIRDGLNNEPKIIVNGDFNIKIDCDDKICEILKDPSIEEYIVKKIRNMGLID